MKLKLDANGNAVLQDGHPVYTHDDGVDRPFDAAATAAAIKARNAEAKAHRERAEQAEARLKTFEGIEDPEAAKKALGVVANLDAKKLVDAGQVETLKGELNKAWQEKLTVAEKRAIELEQQLHGEVVGGAFARSKFLTDKTVLPPDIAQAYLGKHFKVEGGKLKAVDADGNPIYSKATPGVPAEFDEAVEILVTNHPRRDSILRGDNKSGAGTQPNGGTGGSKTIGRAAFEKMAPAEQHAHIKANGTVVD